MEKSFYRKAHLLVNDSYEKIWDDCLRAKTSREKLEYARQLNNFWPIRQSVLRWRSNKSIKTQLNKLEEKA